MNKYVDKWIEQGRTDEQIDGVLNFMTGQGQKMLEEAIRDFANYVDREENWESLKGVKLSLVGEHVDNYLEGLDTPRKEQDE